MTQKGSSDFSPAENVACRPGFEIHASPEAIRAYIDQARARLVEIQEELGTEPTGLAMARGHEPGILRLALAGRCRDDQNWLLRRWEPWAFALKAAVCILLRREASATIDYFGDAVVVATFDHHTAWGDWGTLYSWQELLVPRSWRRWTYAVMWDGSP